MHNALFNRYLPTVTSDIPYNGEDMSCYTIATSCPCAWTRVPNVSSQAR